ncbi:hypothetical protein EBX93_04990 [bacterium]|jgi:hypothetical protein|nr:hypothetical protein [bacterium]
MVKQIFLCAALLAGSAHAEFKTGNMLLNDMNSTPINQMNALGYVTGVADALMGITFCTPPNVNAGQIYDMVKLYLENNPANRHNTADRIVNHVLKNVWPCAQRGQNL